MSSGSISSVIVWLKVIRWCGKKVHMVLKVKAEDLYRISNCVEKVFSLMEHIKFLGVSSNLEFLPEFQELKEHHFWFIGHESSEVWNGLNDFFG